MTHRIGECSAANSFAICILVGEVALVFRESYKMTSAAMPDGGGGNSYPVTAVSIQHLHEWDPNSGKS